MNGQPTSQATGLPADGDHGVVNVRTDGFLAQQQPIVFEHDRTHMLFA